MLVLYLLKMRNYYDINYFKNYANQKGGECISFEYLNTSSLIEFKCINNHIWKTKATNIIYNNSWCPYCNRNAKDNIETFKKIAIERNGKCLSNEYINSKSKLKFICKHNHTWEAIPENVKNQNVWCPYCGDVMPLTIEEMKKLAIEKGGKCLSDKYIDNSTKLIWQCSKGHVWEATPNGVKSAKHWCPVCKSTKKTIEDAKKLAIKRGGKCLSNEYINNSTNLMWQCTKGHDWNTTYSSIRKNSWCPICDESKGENLIRNFLEDNNIKYFREKRFSNCRFKLPLPFDFYLPDLKICIEFDGIQHFKSIPRFGGDEKLKQTQIKDKIKTDYCYDNNICLIRIAYFEKNIIDKLKMEIFKNT